MDLDAHDQVDEPVPLRTAHDQVSTVDGDWTWVSGETVEPTGVEHCGDLLEALAARSVELRFMHSLCPRREIWETTLHASGIRLRARLVLTVGVGALGRPLRVDVRKYPDL